MSDFEKKLKILLNSYSIDNKTNTPDFLLAKYLMCCIESFSVLMEEHAKYCTTKNIREVENIREVNDLNIIDGS